MLCFITSLRFTTVAHVAIIYAIVPFVAGGLAWSILNERPSVSAVISASIALGGVVVMVGVGGDGGLAGDLLALGMTLTMAIIIVMARHFKSIPAMPAVALTAFVSAVVATPFAHMIQPSLGEFSALAAFGIVNSALGLTLFTLGARLLPSIETALIGALDAPLAPVWVWLFFTETPTVATLVGGAVVFAAVLWMDIEKASAKIRAKGVADDDEDYLLPIYAERLPVRMVLGAPEPCPRLMSGVERPPTLAGYRADRLLEDAVRDAYTASYPKE